MKSNPAWFTTALAVVAIFALAACKSRTRRSYTPPAPAWTPGIAQADVAQADVAQADVAPPPGMPLAPEALDDSNYPPAAPSYPEIGIVDGGGVQADLDAARDKAELERARNEDLERQLRLEQERLASTQERLRDMEARIADMAAPAATPGPAAADAGPGGSAGRLAQDLKARSSADVLQEGDMVVVRVTNGFRAGQDLLKQDVQLIQTLNATADALSRHPGATVAVVGHSDTDPILKSKWTSNDELSMARAQRVAQVLADNGVDRNRISIDGRGAREPLVAPELTTDDKARNRRVEILIRP